MWRRLLRLVDVQFVPYQHRADRHHSVELAKHALIQLALLPCTHVLHLSIDLATRRKSL